MVTLVSGEQRIQNILISETVFWVSIMPLVDDIVVEDSERLISVYIWIFSYNVCI